MSDLSRSYIDATVGRHRRTARTFRRIMWANVALMLFNLALAVYNIANGNWFIGACNTVVTAFVVVYTIPLCIRTIADAEIRAGDRVR